MKLILLLLPFLPLISATINVNDKSFEVDPFQAGKLYITSELPYAWHLDRINQINLPLDSVLFKPRNPYFSDTIVYILDTGIDITHPLFEGRAFQGINLVGGEEDTDLHGHGTHVASTVSGGLGISKSKVVAVKALNRNGTGSLRDVLKGLEYISDQYKKSNHKCIVNMSIGGSFDRTFNDVVNELSKICTVVVAAGNSAADACLYSPASAEKAITVGSLDSDDSVSHFSNTGSCVNIYSPGRTIVGAKRGGGYSSKSGTSMACPGVAGAIAVDPDLRLSGILYLKDKTTEPTPLPTTEPTRFPTPLPTRSPTTEPTYAPTIEPTRSPTALPELEQMCKILKKFCD